MHASLAFSLANEVFFILLPPNTMRMAFAALEGAVVAPLVYVGSHIGITGKATSVAIVQHSLIDGNTSQVSRSIAAYACSPNNAVLSQSHSSCSVRECARRPRHCDRFISQQSYFSHVHLGPQI